MKINSSLDISYEHTTNNVMYPPQDIFEIYNSNKSNKLGTLVCHKSELALRPNYDKSVLAIDYLEVAVKNRGFGTRILKFAEEYSRQIGCNGYITVKSDVSFMPERLPHLFYRKFGFSTFDKKNDIKLDKFIIKNRNATIKDFPCLLMHYPPIRENITFRERCIKVLQKILKKITP